MYEIRGLSGSNLDRGETDFILWVFLALLMILDMSKLDCSLDGAATLLLHSFLLITHNYWKWSNQKNAKTFFGYLFYLMVVENFLYRGKWFSRKSYQLCSSKLLHLMLKAYNLQSIMFSVGTINNKHSFR